MFFSTFFPTRVILNEPSLRWADVESAQICSIEEKSNNVRSYMPQSPFSRSDVWQSPIHEVPHSIPRLTSFDTFSGRIDTRGVACGAPLGRVSKED